MYLPYTRSQVPATVTIIVVLALCYVLAWSGLRDQMVEVLAYSPAAVGTEPWTVLTYPFASKGIGGNLLWELILLYWIYMIGSALELELGSGRLVLAWLVFTVLMAIGIFNGHLVSPPGVTLLGASLPVAALTVTWAVRYRTQVVRMFFVLAIPAYWLAFLTVGLVLFAVGSAKPVHGIIAAAMLAVPWLYGANSIPVWPIAAGRRKGWTADRFERRRDAKETSRLDSAIERQREREERERLRKLFEGSISDEPGTRDRD